MQNNLIEFIYRTTKSSNTQRLLGTFGGTILFLIFTLPFILLPLYLDKHFMLTHLLSPIFNIIVSLPFIIFGSVVMLWSVFLFIKIGGTPVPFNPPRKLITNGPFAFSRNPMTIGLFILMFGIGLYYGSITSLFIFTPLYIILNVLEFKYVEEPELEKRLGNEYTEYRKRVKMFGFKAKVS